MRYSATPAPFPLASATSHSSWSNSPEVLPSPFEFSLHHSPDERQGPADHTILPCNPARSLDVMVVKWTGRLSDNCTQSCRAGRNIRNASRGCTLASDDV